MQASIRYPGRRKRDMPRKTGLKKIKTRRRTRKTLVDMKKQVKPESMECMDKEVEHYANLSNVLKAKRNKQKKRTNMVKPIPNHV